MGNIPSTCQSENGNFLVTLSLCRSIAFSVEICAGYTELLKGLTITDCWTRLFFNVTLFSMNTRLVWSGKDILLRRKC